MFVSAAQRRRYQRDDEQSQAYRDLRENIVERYGKRELQTVNDERAWRRGL